MLTFLDRLLGHPVTLSTKPRVYCKVCCVSWRRPVCTLQLRCLQGSIAVHDTFMATRITGSVPIHWANAHLPIASVNLSPCADAPLHSR